MTRLAPIRRLSAEGTHILAVSGTDVETVPGVTTPLSLMTPKICGCASTPGRDTRWADAIGTGKSVGLGISLGECTRQRRS